MTFRAALSGSGARLAFHVGVLQQYAQRGWRGELYRGTSGGGLVALFAAAGKLDWLAERLTTDLTTDMVLEPAGLWGMLRGHLYSLAPLRRQFDRWGAWEFRLEVPAEVVVFDAVERRGQRIPCPVGTTLRENEDALFATIAIPGVFPPTAHGRWYDGGVTDTVPAVDNDCERCPWVISVATPLDLMPRATPPRWAWELLPEVLTAMMAEVTRGDLEAARDVPAYRLHVLSDAERYDGLTFDPKIARELLRLGQMSAERSLGSSL